MSAISTISNKAELVRKQEALLININASIGLQNVLKTNLGPKGTLKMLVSASGDLKLTKDGNVLLKEMQIQHPTAALIARNATAQDQITGDGTTSSVLLIGELMKLSKRYLDENIHPRVIADGIEIGKREATKFLDEIKSKKDFEKDHELLSCIARSSLKTKVHHKLADKLTPIVVDSVLTIRKPNEPIDLFMVEIMHMQHKSDTDSQLIKGLVLDHGARHVGMPKSLKNAYILTMNVSLEFDKASMDAEMVWGDVEAKEKLVSGERKFVEDKVRAIINLKRQVCNSDDKQEKHFVVINQKGIDPPSLDMFAKEGILALRRAKRRNMERLALACGGSAVNSVDDMTPAVLGFAGSVHEHVLGEDKYTFIEDVKNPYSCTILVKGPNSHTINQVKDAVRDGLRAVKNALEDGAIVPGAGAFEIATSRHLHKYAMEKLTGRIKLGVQVLADALLVIPKTLAVNSGLDQIDTLLKLQEEHEKGHHVGLDLHSGEPMDPAVEGIWDNYRVKRQLIQSASVIASQLLLVDEILKAGKSGTGGGGLPGMGQ
eukprot:TRINITY_DN1221_c0_g2_i3.p1 TRINITY_DN1221_c0_g2~~TRINITY_DN1221_c0_g2_i3.p1  ORF type:complete len:545 (+),score=117.49 TRINITY_DN1221_c0_g2_i3:22-1656(+)